MHINNVAVAINNKVDNKESKIRLVKNRFYFLVISKNINFKEHHRKAIGKSKNH